MQLGHAIGLENRPGVLVRQMVPPLKSLQAPRFGQELEAVLEDTLEFSIAPEALPNMVTVKPNVSKAFSDKVTDILERMPAPMLKALNEKKLKVVVCRNLVQGNPSWLKPLSRLRDKYTLAVYQPARKTILLPERTIPKLLSPKKDQDIGMDEYTVYHEFGHAVDDLLGNVPLKKRQLGKAVGYMGLGAGVFAGTMALAALVPQVGLGLGLFGAVSGYSAFKGVSALSKRTSASGEFQQAYKQDKAFAHAIYFQKQFQKLAQNSDEAFANVFASFFFRNPDTRFTRKLLANSYDLISQRVMPPLMLDGEYRKNMRANTFCDESPNKGTVTI